MQTSDPLAIEGDSLMNSPFTISIIKNRRLKGLNTFKTKELGFEPKHGGSKLSSLKYYCTLPRNI
jgi:hypothetical protein